MTIPLSLDIYFSNNLSNSRFSYIFLIISIMIDLEILYFMFLD